MRLLTLSLVLSLVFCGARSSRAVHVQSSLPVYGHLAQFTLVDQDDHAIRTSDLAGRPWIVDFIFTNCTTACPVMTEYMRTLRQALGPDRGVGTATVTVDPLRDHPRELRAYAALHDTPDTLYLTGEESQILALMKSVYMAPPRVDRIQPEMHSSGFVLIDAEGAVRGIYYRRTDAEFQRMLRDARSLGR